MKLVAEKPSQPSESEWVACSVVRGSDFGDVWHYHAECEITLVRRGGSERWVGDRLDPLRPGAIAFLGPDLPHDYRNAPLPHRRPTAVDAVVVHFSPTLLGEGWAQRAAMDPLRRLFERARRGLRIGGRARDYAETALTRMTRARGIRRLILLLDLLDHLAHAKTLTEISSEGFRMEPQTYAADRIGKVCAHIEKNPASPVRVPELARMTGLSESAFSRLFKKCTNATIPQYINRYRIAHACRLLAETDLTVSEIIRVCGYLSPAHFQRQFQKIHGRSPTEYRQNVRDPF